MTCAAIGECRVAACAVWQSYDVVAGDLRKLMLFNSTGVTEMLRPKCRPMAPNPVT